MLSKTGNKFSSIPFDQVHEQENKVVKSEFSAAEDCGHGRGYYPGGKLEPIQKY